MSQYRVFYSKILFLFFFFVFFNIILVFLFYYQQAILSPCCSFTFVLYRIVLLNRLFQRNKIRFCCVIVRSHKLAQL